MAQPYRDSDYVPLSDDSLCACCHLLRKHYAGLVIRASRADCDHPCEDYFNYGKCECTGDEVRVVILCGECAANGTRRSPLGPRFRVNRCLLPVPV